MLAAAIVLCSMVLFLEHVCVCPLCRRRQKEREPEGWLADSGRQGECRCRRLDMGLGLIAANIFSFSVNGVEPTSSPAHHPLLIALAAWSALVWTREQESE